MEPLKNNSAILEKIDSYGKFYLPFVLLMHTFWLLVISFNLNSLDRPLFLLCGATAATPFILVAVIYMQNSREMLNNQL